MDLDRHEELFHSEERLGEEKISRIRVAGIVVFYLNELLNYHVLGVSDPAFHASASIVAAVWMLWAAPLWYAVAWRGCYHRSLKYATSGLDIALLTWLILGGADPAWSLVPIYYLLIAFASLRYSRKATLASAGIAAVSLLFAHIFCVNIWPDSAMKPHVVTINIISIVFMGLIAGNVVFQLRAIVLRLVRDIMKRERAEGALTRYLSRQVAEQVLQREDGAALLSGRRQHVAVLFSDIRGFTPMSESMDPVELLSLLNRYFQAMIEVIFKYDGTLDKFVGDAVMVVFGAPLGQADAELRAVRCARDMHAALDRFNRSQAQTGGRHIPMGISIHAGEVVAGNLGSEERMEYTVLGDVVNLTQRLQGKAGAGHTIVSDAVEKKARSDFKFEALPPFKVKGRAEPVTAFRLRS